jgi:hypothetical protein
MTFLYVLDMFYVLARLGNVKVLRVMDTQLH